MNKPSVLPTKFSLKTSPPLLHTHRHTYMYGCIKNYLIFSSTNGSIEQLKLSKDNKQMCVEVDCLYMFCYIHIRVYVCILKKIYFVFSPPRVSIEDR